MKKEVIYLDSHATTRVDQDVLNSMMPYFTQHYGNGNHKAGWKTDTAIENARFQVASLIGARPTEIIFTSGATEAINLALLGLVPERSKNRKHLVTQKTEHKAVLQCIEVLKARGFRVTMLDVDAVGRINLEELRQVVTKDTLVVAIMLVNNEIGTVQPVKEIGQICRQAGARFFCDITQGLGWHAIDVDEMNIDLASMSAHKVYGPRGIGALFVRRKKLGVTINPILFGGGQERGLRPGTANLPGIVGFGKACELWENNAIEITRKIKMLRDQLSEHLFSAIEGIKFNGCPKQRHPGNLNLAIPTVTGEELIGQLPNIIFSTGSACTSGSAKPSHVIAALGVESDVLHASFRFGVSKFNTTQEIDYVGAQIVKTTKRLQTKRI